ncbi:MAG: MFS transporter, partial [Gammaproteobacteria bacterium]|nr:MFS transporter [Gammaproteobacteria bacterium]
MAQQDGRSFYYGWVIAFASGFVLLLTNGMTLGGLNVFDKPLLDSLNESMGGGVTLAGLKTRDAITLAVGGLMAPIAGAAADRFGVRPLMVLGALLLALGYFLYSTVDSLSGIYWIHLLFAGTLASCGLVVNVILISRWFVRDRGLALGIALAGTSLGNGTMPPVNAALMAEIGWRASFAWTSLLPLLLVPVILFIIRERPADLGPQLPVGGRAGGGQAEAGGMSLPAAVRTRNFWLLAFIAMFSFFSIIGTQAHLNLYMLGRGFSQMDAGFSYTVLFYLGLLGKVLNGLLADRLGKKRVFVATLAVMVLGTLILRLPQAGSIWMGLALFGLGWGGLYTLLQLLAADYFGPRHLGKILGAITVLDTLGGGLGPPLIGAIRDSSGSYDQAFLLV